MTGERDPEHSRVHGGNVRGTEVIQVSKRALWVLWGLGMVMTGIGTGLFLTFAGGPQWLFAVLLTTCGYCTLMITSYLITFWWFAIIPVAASVTLLAMSCLHLL